MPELDEDGFEKLYDHEAVEQFRRVAAYVLNNAETISRGSYEIPLYKADLPDHPDEGLVEWTGDSLTIQFVDQGLYKRAELYMSGPSMGSELVAKFNHRIPERRAPVSPDSVSVKHSGSNAVWSAVLAHGQIVERLNERISGPSADH